MSLSSVASRYSSPPQTPVLPLAVHLLNALAKPPIIASPGPQNKQTRRYRRAHNRKDRTFFESEHRQHNEQAQWNHQAPDNKAPPVRRRTPNMIDIERHIIIHRQPKPDPHPENSITKDLNPITPRVKHPQVASRLHLVADPSCTLHYTAPHPKGNQSHSPKPQNKEDHAKRGPLANPPDVNNSRPLSLHHAPHARRIRPQQATTRENKKCPPGRRSCLDGHSRLSQ